MKKKKKNTQKRTKNSLGTGELKTLHKRKIIKDPTTQNRKR